MNAHASEFGSLIGNQNQLCGDAEQRYEAAKQKAAEKDCDPAVYANPSSFYQKRHKNTPKTVSTFMYMRLWWLHAINLCRDLISRNPLRGSL